MGTRLSVENLYHFCCRVCSKWWTIGDPELSKSDWHCPWCGLKQEFDLQDVDTEEQA